MTQSIADIAGAAFTTAAAAVSGVIKSGVLTRDIPADYDPESGEVLSTAQSKSCRLVFAGSGGGAKYAPELVATPPEELVYLEGLASMPPKLEDAVVVDGTHWRITQPPRDIAQGAGLWAAVVRAA